MTLIPYPLSTQGESEVSMGSIYKRGKTYWIKYYRNGKPYRESTQSKKEADAKRLLKKREGEISSGKLPGIYFDKVLFDELVADLETDYLVNGQNVKDLTKRISHLNPAFEAIRVVDITTPRINTYIEDRLEQGAANATINRELAALKRMLNLGAGQTPPKVDRVPKIPMLKENNVRKGFFEHGAFLALRDALPSFLKPYVTFAYKFGCRESEISKLTWKQVDLDQGIVRLEVGETKNDEGRTLFLDKELKEIFLQLWEDRIKSENVTPYVFPNQNGNDRIKDFRKAWNKACRDAGLGYGYKLNSKYVAKYQNELPAGPILHDSRRTAVRNLVRSGVPERVAMMISGHKTRSIFDRYNIVSEEDLKLASQKQESYLNSQMGTKTGTIVDFAQKKESAQNG